MTQFDSRAAAQPRDTGRLEAFSDGVFAIAITLLVLEIRLPPAEEMRAAGGLAAALARLWPSYVGYVISFIIIGIMWANHHSLMKLIGRVDHTFITLNLILLLFISFTPFPTAVMAEHLADPHERATAVAFYCGSFTLTAVWYIALWLYASRGRRLIADHVSDRALAAVTRAYIPGAPLYLAATLLAPVSATLSLTIVTGLALLYMLPGRGAHVQDE